MRIIWGDAYCTARFKSSLWNTVDTKQHCLGSCLSPHTHGTSCLYEWSTVGSSRITFTFDKGLLNLRIVIWAYHYLAGWFMDIVVGEWAPQVLQANWLWLKEPIGERERELSTCDLSTRRCCGVVYGNLQCSLFFVFHSACTMHSEYSMLCEGK